MYSQKVSRFRISLTEIEPEIWREIDVPSDYNFWELHVAIQDAMGWLDYHLHEFRPRKKSPTDGKRVGIPQPDFDDIEVIPGWEISIKKHFTTLGNTIDYTYDFGDSWEHEVTLIGMFLADENAKIPNCHAGERACPPEDCGSVPGYYNLLEVLSSPANDGYEEISHWLQNHAKKYWPYKPDYFSAKRTKFSDPYQRWCNAFGVEPE